LLLAAYAIFGIKIKAAKNANITARKLRPCIFDVIGVFLLRIKT
jgi:hypothetical protein